MNIEEYNRKIMHGCMIKVERNETIRGSVNHKLIASLKDHWAEHGFPTEEQYVKHIEKVRCRIS